MTHLTDKKVAILATNGFEDSELIEPLKELRSHGANVDVISTDNGQIEGAKGTIQEVARTTTQAKAEDYDALVLPGGVKNGDTIRLDPHAIEFVRGFFDQAKPVGVICHGGWILTDADVLRGRRMTSFASLKTDLRNAGADWVDEEVVVDNGLISSRTPRDLPAFSSELIEAIASV